MQGKGKGSALDHPPGLHGAARRLGLTLPEGEENDSLDGDELEDRLKRAQQVHGGKVEEEEGIKSQADREVVDDGDVEIAASDTAGGEQAAE